MTLLKPLLTLACLLIAYGLAVPSDAQEVETWGTSGNWVVKSDPARNFGCFIEREMGGGTVQIGFDFFDESAFISVTHSGWGEIGEGELIAVLFDLDGEYFEGEARGLYSESTPAAELYFVQPDFLDEVAKGTTLSIYDENEAVILAIDLSGVTKGLSEIRACQKDVQS